MFFFSKIFYNSVSSMSTEEINSFRALNQITFPGNGWGPNPIRTFEEAGFPQTIAHPIMNAGFDAPTPIQAQGWPIALSGHDMIGIAETGSGKTLAFLLPGMVHIMAQPKLRWGKIINIIRNEKDFFIFIQEFIV